VQGAAADKPKLAALLAATVELERLAALASRSLNTAVFSEDLSRIIQGNERNPKRMVQDLGGLERKMVRAGIPGPNGVLYTPEPELTSGGVHGVGWPEADARSRSGGGGGPSGNDQGAFASYAELYFVIEWATRNLQPGTQAVIPAADLPDWFRGIVYPVNGDRRPARGERPGEGGPNPGVYVWVGENGVIHAYPGNNIRLGN
jgi:hypothetical protein